MGKSGNQYEPVKQENSCLHEHSWDITDREITQMGYFKWRPHFFQLINKPPFFVAVFGIANFFMVMTYGILGLIIPTLETVFNLNSKQTGFILMANDISGTIAAIVMANYCSSRKIRWISMGMFIVVISALLPASTTLMVEYPRVRSYNSSSSETNQSTLAGLCNETYDVNDENDDVGAYAARNHKFYWFHVIGSLLQGVGGTPPGIAGSTYMDEIFTQKSFGIAISLLYVVSFLGYPLAMILGSASLSYYVTLNAPDGLTMASKEWVGAWWMGLVFPSIMVFILLFFVLLFPRQMPAALKVLSDKVNKGITTAEEKTQELNRSIVEITNDTFPAFKRLLKNKSLNFLIIGDCFMFFQIGAFSFYPKIYQMLYRLDGETVGMVIGISNIAGFAMGLVLGGSLIKCKAWKAKELQLIYSILSLIAIPFSLGLLIYCPVNEYAGIDVGYSNTSISRMPGLKDQCNTDCSCTTGFYEPVCDNGVTYFSPCYAGCRDSPYTDHSTNMTIFPNCSCTATGTSTLGQCGGPCSKKLMISLVITTFGTVIAFAGFAAHAIIYQRIVSETDRTLAQGFRQTATRLLGTLPSPVLFGWVIDNYCTVWRETDDGTVGNCWVYDITGFIFWFCLIRALLSLLSCGFYLLCWWFYPENVILPPTKKVNLEKYEMKNEGMSSPSSDKDISGSDVFIMIDKDTEKMLEPESEPLKSR